MSYVRKEQIGDATLYLGDCLEILPTLPKVDAVITDPPYSSGGQFRGDRAQDTRTKYVNIDSWNKALPEFSGDTRDQRSFHFWAALWASAARSITRPEGIACFFTDWRQLPISSDYLQAGGWVWRGIVPWAKKSYRPQLGRFGAQCEYVVWGSNGPLPVEREVGCLPGFFDYSSPAQRQHVTQKPDELMREIVEIVPAGCLVLDPFMGSGSTGVACAQLGRKFIGIEIEPRYFDIACRRIEQAYAQGRLFEPEPKKQGQAALFGEAAE
jgi:site-specific DNA-methyltransferase (adenine-specific)